jgi:3',5'-cyclic AMP phosphodiesterase CpdA
VACVTPQVVVVSDSHFSGRTPEAERNWCAVLRHVEAVQPDLVVHVGDLTVDGAHRPEELDVAKEQLDRLSRPWRAVPGNHDVGENPAGETTARDEVTGERLGRWRGVFGADHWVAEVGPWRVLGVDAQLFGSGTADEDDQWAFLEGALARRRKTVLVTHKPLTAGRDELASAPPYRFVPLPARERLVELSQAGGVEIVLSGHVHQQRALDAARLRHLWVTTTWAVLPDWLQAPVGAKRCGLVELELPELDGGPSARFVEPDGLTQLTLGDDIPSPYEPAANEPAG